MDRLIKKKRIKKYKYYRKLFQARDAARKYVKKKMYVKHIECSLHKEFLKCASGASIAERLIDRRGELITTKRPKPPVSQRPNGTIDK